jgi:hypothetical protein
MNDYFLIRTGGRGPLRFSFGKLSQTNSLDKYLPGNYNLYITEDAVLNAGDWFLAPPEIIESKTVIEDHLGNHWVIKRAEKGDVSAVIFKRIIAVSVSHPLDFDIYPLPDAVIKQFVEGFNKATTLGFPFNLSNTIKIEPTAQAYIKSIEDQETFTREDMRKAFAQGNYVADLPIMKDKVVNRLFESWMGNTYKKETAKKELNGK